MTGTVLTDAQWCMLDLLMRARERGVTSLSRKEILASPSLPSLVRAKLVWAALTMPAYVTWTAQHDFSITDAGVQIFNLRFGRGTTPATPTQIADEVIYLPGPTSVAS